MNHDLPPWARALLRIRVAMYVLGACLTRLNVQRMDPAMTTPNPVDIGKLVERLLFTGRYAAETEREATNRRNQVRAEAASALTALVEDRDAAVRAKEALATRCNQLSDIRAALEAERDRLREAESNACGRGMVIAAAILVRTWGDEVQAEEILGAAGLDTVEKMRAAGVDAYDVQGVRSVLRAIKSRRARQALGAEQ